MASLPCHRRALLAAAVCCAAAIPGTVGAQARAVLSGRVLDARTRLPLAGARVFVTGRPDTLTADDGGRFIADSLVAGALVLEVRAIGYGTTRWTLELQEGRLDVAIELESRLPLLDTVLIAAPARFNDATNWRSAAAFELRRQRGNGRFVTPELLSQSSARTLAEILRTVPGVWVVCRGAIGQCEVRLAAGPRGPCLPRYLLDGHPATNATGSDFPLVRIQGIEIYSAGEAPPEFAPFNDACGVIAMWSRMDR